MRGEGYTQTGLLRQRYTDRHAYGQIEYTNYPGQGSILLVKLAISGMLRKNSKARQNHELTYKHKEFKEQTHTDRGRLMLCTNRHTNKQTNTRTNRHTHRDGYHTWGLPCLHWTVSAGTLPLFPAWRRWGWWRRFLPLAPTAWIPAEITSFLYVPSLYLILSCHLLCESFESDLDLLQDLKSIELTIDSIRVVFPLITLRKNRWWYETILIPHNWS